MFKTLELVIRYCAVFPNMPADCLFQAGYAHVITACKMTESKLRTDIPQFQEMQHMRHALASAHLMAKSNAKLTGQLVYWHNILKLSKLPSVARHCIAVVIHSQLGTHLPHLSIVILKCHTVLPAALHRFQCSGSNTFLADSLAELTAQHQI